MTKNLKRLISRIVFTITLVICVVLSSCEAESYLVEEKPVLISARDIKIRNVPFDEVGVQFDEVSRKLQLDKHRGLVKNDGIHRREGSFGGIEIVDGLVREITYGSYTSYTMLIKSDETTGKFYNLVIEEIDQMTKMFVAKYEPTEEWLLTKGEFKGSLTTYKINDLLTPLDQLETPTIGESPTGGSTDFPTDCNGVVKTTVVVENFICSANEHWPWDIEPCIADVPARIETTYYYECLVSNPNPFTGAPGGSPGNGNPSGPGGSGPSGPTAGGGDPSLTSPIKPGEIATTPCVQLQKLINPTEANLKPAIDSLKNLAGLAVEYGYEIERKVNFDGETYNYPRTFKVSEDQLTVKLDIKGFIIGGLHCHPNKSYAIPSYTDVRWLRDCYAEAKEGLKPVIFSMTVVKNDNGTKSVYAMFITNFDKLNFEVNKVWDNPDYAQITDEREKLDKIHEKQRKKFKESNGELEKSFLQQFGAFGIDIYKATDDSLNNWNKLVLKNNDVDPQPCN